jgi:Zn-dependent metalloprotease
MQFRVLSAAILAALAASSAAQAASPAGLPAARAQALLNSSAADTIRKAPADDFVLRSTVVDRDGTEHVRFDRTYQGLPVIGGDVVLHSKNGVLQRTGLTLKTVARPSVTPAITSQRAITEAGTRFGTGFSALPSSRLVLYARDRSPVLAYEVGMAGVKADQTPTDMRYIVDAKSGLILDQWDTIETITPGGGSGGCAAPVASSGTGKSMFLGNVQVDTSKCGVRYQMLDTTRGGGYTTNMSNRTTGLGTLFVDVDNTWGNNLNTDSATVAVDAHYGVSKTWDYYKNVHGRNGIANDGVGALSRVHYGVSYANAFWSDSCFCMTFGDGDGSTLAPLVALDIAGHEMSHGVTSRTAGLLYSRESGGLNEATSDIMGTMVEYYAEDATDVGDYLVGEKIYKNNPQGTTALRYMFKPSLDGDSPDCYSSTLGDLDVHYSSGVANHFYYLLAEGAVVPSGFGAGTSANLVPSDLVCSGGTNLVGIGREAASKIWYRALTVEMTSSTNYAGARAATIAAADSLYGVGSSQSLAVAAAWNAVSVTAVP